MQSLHRVATAVCAVVFVWGATPAVNAQVRIAQAGDHIAVQIDGRPFTDFYYGAAYPKPYLWPLQTATGLVVTRNFPMRVAPGESNDHPHHRGLFIGYGEINGVNFWENEYNYKTGNRGRIVARKVKDLKSGSKQGSIRAIFEWHDTGGADIMDEDRTMTFYNEPDRRTIDFDVKFTAKVALQWADTKEGFFAIRVADSMSEKNGGKMVNSQGASGEKDVWGKPAKWVDYSGQVDGQSAGILILAHPSNPRYPPRWHSRAYGLFAVNPWGLKDFVGDKNAQGGGLQMAPDESMRLRYRVVIHTSDITPVNIPDLYGEYVRKVK